MMKNSKDIIDPEYGVDSRYNNDKYDLEHGKNLLLARLERLNTVSVKDIQKARLLQLYINMQDFLKMGGTSSKLRFTDFLINYINILYSKHREFADDINITSVKLSHILNGHREPDEAFIQRLILHSEMSYSNISSFSPEIWFHVLYHGRTLDVMAKKEQWSKKENKNVRFTIA